MKILIAYASRKGSTGETAEFMADVLREHQHEVTVLHCDYVKSADEYDAYLIGTGIYKAAWLPAAETFLRKFGKAIGDKPLYYWIMCIRLLEDSGYDHVMDKYVPHHILRKYNVQDGQAFAGKLKYGDIDFSERWTLSVRYDGNENPLDSFDEDYRDWDKIKAWAEKVAVELNS